MPDKPKLTVVPGGKTPESDSTVAASKAISKAGVLRRAFFLYDLLEHLGPVRVTFVEEESES